MLSLWCLIAAPMAGAPPESLADVSAFRLRLSCPVAIEGGPIILRMELEYKGEGAVVVCDWGSDDLYAFVCSIKPATTGRPIRPEPEPVQRCLARPIKAGEPQVSFVRIDETSGRIPVGRAEVRMEVPLHQDQNSTLGTSTRPAVLHSYRARVRRTGPAEFSFTFDRVERGNEPTFLGVLRGETTIVVEPRTNETYNKLADNLAKELRSASDTNSSSDYLAPLLFAIDKPEFDRFRVDYLDVVTNEFSQRLMVKKVLALAVKDERRLAPLTDYLRASNPRAASAVFMVLRSGDYPRSFNTAVHKATESAKSPWVKALAYAVAPELYTEAWARELRSELAAVDGTLPRAALEGTIGLLDARKYRDRERAQRELVASGRRVLPVLKESLRGQPMSAEQVTAIRVVIAEIERRYPIPPAPSARPSAVPGAYVWGQHAFARMTIPDYLVPVRAALDLICDRPESPATITILQALAKNGPDSLVGVEASYLLSQFAKK